uniref:Poliovirus receptor-like n=1 Tax=Pundamilia nyererei TaxID=303518 RepID=A0A3B4G3S6_9CICH
MIVLAVVFDLTRCSFSRARCGGLCPKQLFFSCLLPSYMRASQLCCKRHQEFLSLIVFLFTALQVIGGSVTVVQGGDTAILPCKLRLTDSTEDLTQITWQRRTREKPSNDNFITVGPSQETRFVNGRDDRFKYIGNFNDKNATLQLSNVALKDEGSYTCIFTLFPSGNQKIEIPLKVIVPPFTSVKENLLTLGTEEVLFATCTAAGSKPPAEVRWLTGALGDKVRTTTNSIQYDNGMTTTVSSLFGVPTREINGQQVQCVISGDFLTKEISLPFNIQWFPNFFSLGPPLFYRKCCPPPPLEGAKLQLLSLTSGLNGLYRCKASNPHGSKHSQLYVHVASGEVSLNLAMQFVQIFLDLFLTFGFELMFCHFDFILFPGATPPQVYINAYLNI